MLAPKLPRGFGPYTLVQRLAQGGMAEVFLARQPSRTGIERNLVIKRILPHLSEDREFVQMFTEEARLAIRLTHPNIVHMYDFGREGDAYYIALEYVDGPSLQTILKQSKKPVPKAIAVRIACGVAAGLAYAHALADEGGNALGLVHRDVSPPNILVARDGSVKLVDFGIAKAIHRNPETHSTTLKGKFAYMAPEQFDGVVTQRVDLYALGVCLYEMLSGEPLFRHKTVAELIRAVCTSEVDPLSVRAPWVPEALEAIVMRAIHKDPDQRYASAETMLLVMERFLTQNGLVASPMLVGEYVRDVLAHPAASKSPASHDGTSRESDPYDITSVRRQDATPPRVSLPDVTAHPEGRDTMPQAFIVLSSRPATEPPVASDLSPAQRERLTAPLASGDLPPPPVRPKAAPLKTPLPPAKRPTTKLGAAEPEDEFEKTTAPRPVFSDQETPAEGSSLEAAAARLASRKTPSPRAPEAHAPTGLVGDRTDESMSLKGASAGGLRPPERGGVRGGASGSEPSPRFDGEPEKTIPDPGGRAYTDDLEKTTPQPTLGPRDDPAAIHLLAAKLAALPDPTEPEMPAFPVAPPPQSPKAVPQPTREPPRPDAGKQKPSPQRPPAVKAAAEPLPLSSLADRVTKPTAPPAASGPAVPAITTPLPRVAPQPAPAIFTAPESAKGPPVPPDAVTFTSTSPLVTADLEIVSFHEMPADPADRVTTPRMAGAAPARPASDEANATTVRAVPDDDAKATVVRPGGIAPTRPPDDDTTATSVRGTPIPPPKPAVADPEDAATRVALRPTPPPAVTELTDVISSPLIPLAPRGADGTLAPPGGADGRATPSAESDAAALEAKPAPSPAIPEASIIVAEGMGSTVILPDAGSVKPVFGPAVGAPPPITAPGVTPSKVVSSSRPRASVILGGMLVVLVAGSIGLWAASRQASSEPTADQDPGVVPEPSKIQPGTPALPEAGERVATTGPLPVNDTQPSDAPTTPADAPPRAVVPPTNERPDTTPSPGSVSGQRADSPVKRQLAPRDSTRRPTPGPRPQVFEPGGEPTRTADEGGTARLFVNTEPWSHVLVAGRDVGTTPVANVEVPAGRVSLTLIDPDGNRFRRTIRVSAGEQKRVFYQLDE